MFRVFIGADNEKGIRFNIDDFSLQVIDAKSNPEQVLRHDASNKVIARLLIELTGPVALGVIYNCPAESFEKSWYKAHENGLERTAKIADVLRDTNSWKVG